MSDHSSHKHRQLWWEIRTIKVIKCPLNSTAQGGENNYPNTKPKKETNAYLNLDVKWWFSLCTYHILPCGSTLGEPMGSPGEWSRFGISFFPAGEGSWLVSETTFMDHGDIPTGFVWGSATDKRKNASPGSVLDVRKRASWKSEQKKMRTFLCYFCQRKVNIILQSINKRLKKVVLLFLTTS